VLLVVKRPSDKSSLYRGVLPGISFCPNSWRIRSSSSSPWCILLMAPSDSILAVGESSSDLNLQAANVWDTSGFLSTFQVFLFILSAEKYFLKLFLL